MSIISAGSSSPWSAPTPWDSITIAGVVYGGYDPGGKVRIRGAARAYKIDSKDPQGADGWSISYRGFKPKTFSIDFFVWTDAQYTYFTGSVLKAISYSGVQKTVTALGVYHPSLQPLGITQIFVHEIGALEQISEDGMYRCTISVSEYRNPPPLNTTATPIGAKVSNPATSPGVQPPTAVVARLNMIARLKANVAAGGSIGSNFSGPI